MKNDDKKVGAVRGWLARLVGREFYYGQQWRPTDFGGRYTVYGTTRSMVVLFINTSWDTTVWHVVPKVEMRTPKWEPMTNQLKGELK